MEAIYTIILEMKSIPLGKYSSQRFMKAEDSVNVLEKIRKVFPPDEGYVISVTNKNNPNFSVLEKEMKDSVFIKTATENVTTRTQGIIGL